MSLVEKLATSNLEFCAFAYLLIYHEDATNENLKKRYDLALGQDWADAVKADAENCGWIKLATDKEAFKAPL